jgi:hypothetical protein
MSGDEMEIDASSAGGRDERLPEAIRSVRGGIVDLELPPGYRLVRCPPEGDVLLPQSRAATARSG